MTERTATSADVRHDPAAQRFELEMDGSTAVLEYARGSAGTLDLNHTFVPSRLRGRGIASVLAEHALRYAREQNLKVIPSCPFVARYIDTHPEHRPLVA